MFAKATALWVVGLLTLVPYGIYYLLFKASRDQYALLITLVLFWILGYWSLVGPLLMAVKARTIFQTLRLARSDDDLATVLRSQDTKEVAIDLIATENRIPRFMAVRVYDYLIRRLAEGVQAPGGRASKEKAKGRP